MKPVIKFTIREEHLERAQKEIGARARSTSCPIAQAINDTITDYPSSVIVGLRRATINDNEYPLPELLCQAIQYWDHCNDTNFEQVLNKEWELTPLTNT